MKAGWIIFIFSLTLILISIFSFRTGFTDSAEYINVAKALAGLANTNVFIMHSITYSLFLSLFLKLFPFLTTLRLVNLIWLVLDAFLLYWITKSKKALLLWTFSPIVYYMSTWISPMLPISFFFLLAYHYIKKFESTNRLKHLAISALSIGAIAALREQMLALSLIFFLIFFFNKPLRLTIYFLMFMLPTFAIRFVVDYYYFGIPFYSFLTFAGSLFLGNLEGGGLIHQEWYLFPFIIAPMTYLLYKLDKRYYRELIFLGIFLLSTIPLGQLRFFMPIAPFLTLLLSRVISDKQLIINNIIASLMILVILVPYFSTATEEARVIGDLNEIHEEIDPDVAIVTNGGAYSFEALPTSYWGEKGPRYIWSRDLQLFLDGNTEYRKLNLQSYPIFDADKLVELEVSVHTNKDSKLDSNLLTSQPYFILNKKEFKYNGLTKTLTIIWRGELDIINVNLVKCYQELCVFKVNDFK